jgi:hypothetical protein
MIASPVRARRLRKRACALLAGTLMSGLLPGGGVLAADAPPAPAGAPAAAAPSGSAAAPADGTRSYTLTLKQLGALYPLNITGVDGSNGVPFSVRADEVVMGATLKLDYAYSPSLLPDLSHINVLVNGEVATSIPVPKDDGGKSLQKTVEIPARLMTDFNRLNLQLIGHYTMQCEDPMYSSLWLNVGNQSTLQLDVKPLTLRDDLSLLPLPFFDRRDVRPLVLPVVFGGDPDQASLEAAGILSSWFGGLASYRGARFPVSINDLPKQGNGVVFALGNANVAGLDTPAAATGGPTVSVVANPNDPNGKLLVIRGQSSADLKTAASALALGAQTMSGPSATITKLQTLAPRKPYDAPNWLPSDRPVRFGELVPMRNLSVVGYRPDTIRVDLRLPPDLFGWNRKGVPVDIKYRYTPRPYADKSTLTLNVNNQFVQAISLPSGNAANASVVSKVLPDATVPADDHLRIPLFMLTPRSQLQFYYQYDIIKQRECADTLLDNVHGAIDPDSTIDISRIPHFMAMPDLAAFDDSGFPFTRMADLSQTTVVLPDGASPNDYSAYLTLLGRMGESTGYPATGVTVARAGQADRLNDKDLLVIASGNNQPLLQQWAQYMPAGLNGQAKRFTLSDMVYRATSWLDNERPVPRDALSFDSSSSDAVLTGFESPLNSGRSVVVLAAGRPEGLPIAMEALLDRASDTRRIEGSLALVRGKQVDSLLATDTYYVGHLGPLEYIQWFFSRHVWLLMLVCLLGVALLAAALYWSLRARAQRRLQG